MYQVSDEDSSDSEDGIRFKTHTTRKDSGRSSKSSTSSRNHHRHRRSRSRSPYSDRNSRHSDRSERDRKHSRRKSPDQGYRDHRRDRRSPSRERKRHKETLKSEEEVKLEKSTKSCMKHKKSDINSSGLKICKHKVEVENSKIDSSLKSTNLNQDVSMCGPALPQVVEKCRKLDNIKLDRDSCSSKLPEILKPKEVEIGQNESRNLNNTKQYDNSGRPNIAESLKPREVEKCQNESFTLDNIKHDGKIPESLKPTEAEKSHNDTIKLDNIKHDGSICGPQIPQSMKPKEAENSQKGSQKSDIIKQDSPKISESIEKFQNDICGPKVPEHLQPKVISLEKELIESYSPENLMTNVLNNTSSEEESEAFDVCGPKLPNPTSKPNESPNTAIDEPLSCGPQLPPHLLNKPNTAATEKRIGPTLPDHLRKQLELQAPMQVDEIVESDEKVDESDEDDTYGPLPPELMLNSKNHIALEERALQMKLDKLAPVAEDKTVREEWMIELPTVQAANLGLGPRQFRAKAGPDMSDRTSWTDTPKDKGSTTLKPEKVDLKKEAELMAIKQRDEEQEEMINKHKKKKKRDKSLLEQHQTKLMKKKKKDEADGATVRRPFNRETDMKVNQFDDAQKKSIFKKAQLLDTRFSSGQSKFL